MRIKRLIAGLLTSVAMLGGIPGITAFAYAQEPEETAVAASTDETIESYSWTSEDGSESLTVDSEFTVDGEMELSDSDLMALMGLFFGSVGSTVENPSGTVIVGDKSYLNVRDGAGLDYSVIMHLLNGQQVEVTGEDGDWYQITIPAQVGYVYKDYVNVENTNADGSINITIDEEAMDTLLTLAVSMFFSDESEPALTPDGNLTLVDDIGSSSGAGKQFITLVTKNGNYFYLIIDRDDDGDENVHFLNMVDEADLFALMDEDQVTSYQTQSAVADTSSTIDTTTDTVTTDTSENTDSADTEETTETETKNSGSMLPVVAVVLLLLAGAGGYLFLQTKKKKAVAKRPDPDADYEENVDELDLPEDDEDDYPDEDDAADNSDGSNDDSYDEPGGFDPDDEE